MNFHQLEYIVSVDKNRNFSKAAEDCGVAQSTLSKEIQRLEKQFKILIFDRSRHPVVPTLKGTDLIDQAKLLLEQQRQFIATAMKRNNEPAGDFKLGILPGLAPFLLPLFTHRLGQKYSKLNLSLVEAKPSEMLFPEDSSLDALIAISPFAEGFYETPLFEEEFVLYVSPDHPLSNKEDIIWQEIPFEELLLHEDLKVHFSEEIAFSKASKATNHFQNVSCRNCSMDTILKIIDRNGGITLLPQIACLYMGKRRLRMVRHISSPVPGRTISFVTPRGFQKSRLSKVIIQEIIKSIPSDFRIKLCQEIREYDFRAEEKMTVSTP